MRRPSVSLHSCVSDCLTRSALHICGYFSPTHIAYARWFSSTWRQRLATVIVAPAPHGQEPREPLFGQLLEFGRFREQHGNWIRSWSSLRRYGLHSCFLSGFARKSASRQRSRRPHDWSLDMSGPKCHHGLEDKVLAARDNTPFPTPWANKRIAYAGHASVMDQVT